MSIGKKMTDKQLTQFQQQLMDAAEKLSSTSVLSGNAVYSSGGAILVAEAKAKCCVLIERAVDSDKPRKNADDGIWVRIDD